jgi:hypothetical protein
MNREKRLLLSFLVLCMAVTTVLMSIYPLSDEEDIELKISWPLTPALVEKVSQWEILHENMTFRVEKKENRWVMTSPFETEIHDQKISNFIKQLGQIEPKKEIDNSVALDTLGLKSPQTQITGLGENGNRLFQMSLGLVNTFEQTVFVSVSRSKNAAHYYSLPRLMAFRLGMGVDDFRDKRIYARAFDEKTQISYQRAAFSDAGFKFKFVIDTMARKGRGSPYHLLEPLRGPADERRMGQLLSLMAEGEIKEMMTEEHGDDLEHWGLHQPLYTLELENPKWVAPVRVVLSPILETSGAFYIARSDVRWVGRFVSNRFQHLDFEMNDVIDKRFFSFNLNAIHRWEIWEQHLGHLILEKKNGEFVMLAPQPALLDRNLVFKAMIDFSFIEGSELMVEETPMMEIMKNEANNKWLAKMSFYDQKNNKLGQLLFFNIEKTLYGFSSQRRGVFRMARGALDRLPKSPDGWLSK